MLTATQQCTQSTVSNKSKPIDEILSYKNEGLVLRLQQKMCLDRENAEDLFMDLKKFLYLVGENPGSRFGPPEQIDEAWHHFILFTHDYGSFCSQYFDKFIHHVPETSDRFIVENKIMGKTFAVATKLFGSLSPNWAKSTGSCVGGSCSSDCTQCSGSTNCQSSIN